MSRGGGTGGRHGKHVTMAGQRSSLAGRDLEQSPPLAELRCILTPDTPRPPDHDQTRQAVPAPGTHLRSATPARSAGCPPRLRPLRGTGRSQLPRHPRSRSVTETRPPPAAADGQQASAIKPFYWHCTSPGRQCAVCSHHIVGVSRMRRPDLFDACESLEGAYSHVDHRSHQRRRLPARPRRTARPHHPRRNLPPPRPRFGQMRTFTEHAGALSPRAFLEGDIRSRIEQRSSDSVALQGRVPAK